MAEQIFRKKSLDKLSSPEQLDKLIVINSPMTWLALAGGGLIILVTIFWGVLGHIPITEEGQGVLLGDGVLSSVYAGTQGVVEKSYIRNGDVVKKGDVLYEVSNMEVEITKEQLEERIKKVELVTYTSENDEITSDNQTLINLKSQKKGLNLESKANTAAVIKMQDEYVKLANEVIALKVALDEAESKYYDNISNDNGSSVEYEYSAAASEYQSAESAYQSALSQYNKAQQEAAPQIEQLKKAWQDAKTAYETYIAGKPSEDTPEDAEDDNGEDTAGEDSDGENGDGEDSGEGNSGYDQEKETELKKAMDTAKSNYDKAVAQLNQGKKTVDGYRSTRDNKKADYDDKKFYYESYIATLGQKTSQKTQIANDYNKALSEYNTAKTKLESMEMEIKTMELQMNAGVEQEAVQADTLKTQFEASKSAILDGLNKQLKEYNMLNENMEIRATTDGTVYSTFVTVGSQVGMTSEVARINEHQGETKMQAVYFLHLDSGKNVKEGMKINIYPNTLPKEEYGHMSGTVVSVADYVTSAADVYNRLGDSSLVQNFSKEGVVVEIVCEIDRDESTASGFAWSSKKGKQAELTEGTLLTGTIVIEEVPPITMLIPKLKEKLHLE